MPSYEDLAEQAATWADQDPDPVTRDELTALLATARTDEAARAELADRCSGPLEFGTAGLRGALGAGPHRMNRVVVAQAAAGLATYVRRNAGAHPSIVIGFDARHNSDVFARATAAIIQAAGLRACLLPAPLPTPVLAFATRHLGCDAVVMVNASHHPPQAIASKYH